MDKKPMKTSPWKVINRFVTIVSPWLTMIGENCLDGDGNRLEYWRVEKDDSVIVIPIWSNQVLLPALYYRHGPQTLTFDFPGGKIKPGACREDIACGILAREMDIQSDMIEGVFSLTEEGWLVNSAFSNQRLFGYWAEIGQQYPASEDSNVRAYPLTKEGVTDLERNLICLQCRAVFWEFCRKNGV